MANGSLYAQAEEFADELGSLLKRTLPFAPMGVAEVAGDRVIVRPDADGVRVPLFISGDQLASLEVRLQCQLDSRGRWLAVANSRFTLTAAVDRTPVLRFEYMRDAQSSPSAHLQVHAHRGALTHLLSRSGHAKPHEMSALHLPVGGARFRPCLEDLIQFLLEECRFDPEPGWQTAIREGRERWRRRQARAVIRDFEDEAVA
ncbi:MAG: hypothetical protein LBJ87_09585, partial [bacterium]|nr:hypothetical protein [bacterium]